MISSKNLKDFVKMHEYKLNAKINARRAEKLDTELGDVHWGTDCLDDRHLKMSEEHWHIEKTDKTTGRLPKSRYFNFILTATHQ